MKYAIWRRYLNFSNTFLRVYNKSKTWNSSVKRSSFTYWVTFNFIYAFTYSLSIYYKHIHEMFGEILEEERQGTLSGRF